MQQVGAIVYASSLLDDEVYVRTGVYARARCWKPVQEAAVLDITKSDAAGHTATTRELFGLQPLDD